MITIHSMKKMSPGQLLRTDQIRMNQRTTVRVPVWIIRARIASRRGQNPATLRGASVVPSARQPA
ncbi:hypothetical protein [Burkholderia stagnalis]|uniref:hypothetical protein n=1 Tax=Burkholderia stagnalis TaxID=1503054 RepID=UPI0016270334|nr:hypothetical protein [Burkholderia stagnalis]